MSKNVFRFALGAMLLALCFLADAQQPVKVPRIAIPILPAPLPLSCGPHRGIPAGSARAWVCRREKTSSLSIDTQRENYDRLPALAAELVRLKVDVIVTGWSGSNPSRQGSNKYDSHSHGAR